MSATILYWAGGFALLCFALGLGCAAIRLILGPGAEDRVLALDTLYINGAAQAGGQQRGAQRHVLVSTHDEHSLRVDSGRFPARFRGACRVLDCGVPARAGFEPVYGFPLDPM